MYRKALPEPVVKRAQQLGAEGLAWLDQIDAVTKNLLTKHDLAPGAVLHGGTESLVVEATTKSGELLVVKLGLPGSADLGREALVYQLAEGSGYATLVAYEADSNAIILERLGQPLEKEQRPHEEEIDVLCQCMARSWLLLSEPQAQTWQLMSGADKAQWHIDFLSDRAKAISTPCPTQTLDLALQYAHARKNAHNPDTALLIHGDAHSLNTLKSDDGEYKFIDPEGLFAEKACDLSIPMREYNAPLLEGNILSNTLHRCEKLSQLTTVEPQGIWEWGYVERVSTAFVLADVGMREESDATFAVANQINADYRW
ncbi:MAG: aminoglycoside phosphotransferase family protein [Pseudomonadota bacterium]